jgi:chitin synthase
MNNYANVLWILFFFHSTRTETQGWDVFRVLPPEAESVSTANQQFLETTIKVIKVIVYLLTFIIVLTSGVIAKGSILFMTSQLRPDKNIPYCNVDIGKIPFY